MRGAGERVPKLAWVATMNMKCYRLCLLSLGLYGRLNLRSLGGSSRISTKFDINMNSYNSKRVLVFLLSHFVLTISYIMLAFCTMDADLHALQKKIWPISWPWGSLGIIMTYVWPVVSLTRSSSCQQCALCSQYTYYSWVRQKYRTKFPSYSGDLTLNPPALSRVPLRGKSLPSILLCRLIIG